jgi:hypothetical protein
MWFEGKWMHLEDIMLSEVSQAQDHKGHMFSLIHRRQIQKINIYTKTNMIIYKLMQNMFVIVEPLYRTWRRKERKR